jgi:hypothetical protein
VEQYPLVRSVVRTGGVGNLVPTARSGSVVFPLFNVEQWLTDCGK